MLPAARYDTAEERGVFWERLFERLAGIPGIEAAGASTAPPFSQWEWQLPIELLDGTKRRITTSIRTVHADYFTALDIPIVAGRNFGRRDRADAEPVVLVNQAFARAHLDGRNPLGERVRLGRTEGTAATIIGVTGDTRHTRLDESAEPEMYRALAQAPPAGLIVVLRTSGDPRGAIAPLRAALHEIDPDLPLQQVLTMDAMIDRTVAARRFHLALLSMFSAIAVVLAGLGVYSVMAQAVGHRRREIGIRIALGADRADVERLILRAGGTLVACGLALGLAGAMATSGVLRAMLFGVSTRDPLTLGAVLAGFGALGLLAAWAPARRAGRVDPVEVLRPE
jgi:putative ABC transport system permease protein